VALFAFGGTFNNCVQIVSKKFGLDAANCIAEIVLGRDVVAIEYGPSAVTRHAQPSGA
jgi:hypothetical protein